MKIALDIETLHLSKNEWVSLMDVDSSTSETDLAKLEKEYERSVFDATFSRIVCIGVIVFQDDMTPADALAWYGPNEKEILGQFWSRMAVMRPELIIAHNGLSFDLPFIKKRSIIHQVKPTMEISLAKFRTTPVYDTMAVWANWETRNSVKLDVLARALGVEGKSGSGENISGMCEKQQWDEIAKYCLQDAYVAYACYCRMNFIKPVPSSTTLAKNNLFQVA